MSADSAKVSVFVAVPIADAFEIFTKEIDRWWRRGPKYRLGGTRRGTLFMEEGVGGRLFSRSRGGNRQFGRRFRLAGRHFRGNDQRLQGE